METVASFRRARTKGALMNGLVLLPQMTLLAVIAALFMALVAVASYALGQRRAVALITAAQQERTWFCDEPAVPIAEVVPTKSETTAAADLPGAVATPPSAVGNAVPTAAVGDAEPPAAVAAPLEADLPVFETARSWTFVSERTAAIEFTTFLRDVARGTHPLGADDVNIDNLPHELMHLLDNREFGIDWMMLDELVEIYRGWCRISGYMPMDRGALLGLMGQSLGAEKRRLWLTSDHCARLRERYAGVAPLPGRPTCVRVWSWREMTEADRVRRATSRQVWSDPADTVPHMDTAASRKRKRQLKPQLKPAVQARPMVSDWPLAA